MIPTKTGAATGVVASRVSALYIGGLKIRTALAWVLFLAAEIAVFERA
jgi:hypothetical protein